MLIRTLLILAVLAGLGAAVWYYGFRPQPAAEPQTAAVTRGDIEETVLATGTISASSVVSVGAQVSGRIEALNATLGQQVKKGELIAEIDPLDKENAVKLTKAALSNIEAQRRIQAANLGQAQRAATRAEQLKTQNLMSDVDYQTAQAGVETAEAQLDAIDAQIVQAQLNVDSAELALSRTKITAPMDGTVVAVMVDVGQTVNAAQTAPTIVKLADLGEMVVKAGISEADVPNVVPGQRVYFTLLGDPDRPIEARLASIEPAPESFQSETGASGSSSPSSSAIYYNGVFEVPNPDGRLRISMTAQVTIVIKDAKDALLVPSSALGAAGPGGHAEVTVYDPASKVETPRQVTVGINNKVMAEILDGLSEGERVVANSTGTSGSAGTSGGGRSGRLAIGGRLPRGG